MRVGLEDGLTVSKSGKREFTSNEFLVERVLEIATALDKKPMSGAALKKKLTI